jgi:phosphatidylinositol glycan class O
MPSVTPSSTKVNGILSSFRTHTLGSLLLLFVLFTHLSGLYLFTRGFLLTRLALSETITCSPDSLDGCTVPPTYNKAVFLIIDALRFDFISPDPPSPLDLNHHNVLTLPSELSRSSPAHSHIFHAYSDPPTTTLQRLKGLTTGSLPTFIDAGSNFAGSAIAEDSWILQLERANKTVGFMGDNTWLSIYPDSFSPNLTFPFDSFNVEDLHSVDQGVKSNLLPLLEPERQGEWDVLIGHFLGVDHVGHRLGPSHGTMRAKLEEMDAFLRQVVEKLDDETLLVVLGDHGMDHKGDHGGDGLLETASGLWVYSKGPELSPRSDLDSPRFIFPGSSTSFRSVQQIDLVPSLSLLLGLPIPYNNLGSLIPELFSSSPHRERAFNLNTQQIYAYLESYAREGGSNRELAQSMSLLRRTFSSLTPSSPISDHVSFARQALHECRLLWAQFNSVLMLLGLAILLLSLPTLWIVYSSVAHTRSGWESWTQVNLGYGIWGGLAGGAIGFVSGAFSSMLGSEMTTLSTWETTMYSAALASQLAIIVPNYQECYDRARSSLSRASLLSLSGPILLALHVLFLSTNSFILWEDRISLYFLATILLLYVAQSPAAPTPHLRLRMIGLTLLFLAALRISSVSTVCREENLGFCNVTFYSSASTPSSPFYLLLLAFPTAYFLPDLITAFLDISKSSAGLAPLFLRIWRGVLIAGSAYWLLDRGETWEEINQDRIPLLKWIKTQLARLVLGAAAFGGYYLWSIAPLCIDVRRAGELPPSDKPEEDDGNPLRPPKPSPNQIVVLGFANSYGSSYLLFLLPFFALLWTVSQPTAQIVLALALVSILSILEIVDSQRDSESLQRAFASTNPADFDPSSINTILPPTFTEISILGLFSLSLFFATGHQPVLSSIQWASAFVGFPTLTYPFSPLLVGLNTWGPLLLVTLAVPLLGMWNVSPKPKSYVPVMADGMKAVLGFVLWQSCVAVATVAWAALHRFVLLLSSHAPRT